MLHSIQEARFEIGGEVGRRLEAVTRQWILPAPSANPGMLAMFRERDRKRSHSLVPWAGEFAGKYLTHAVQVWRLTRDAELGEHIRRFVGEFVVLQAEDGYLGPWPETWRLRKGPRESLRSDDPGEPWDAWGHYHAMTGLLLWHADTGDRRALQCARRIGDLFCRRFLGDTGERLHDAGAHEMNQAPVHSLAWLYRLTGVRDYLRMAERIVEEFAIPPAGDYLNAALAGREFWQTPKPRWESLHPIMGLCELYHATGHEHYRRAFEHLWWSMLSGDRHNNGGFTSGERATGDPYHAGAIETCCTVAWMAMSVEMLRLTGLSIVTDELELSMLNSGLGMMSPSGRWVTYDTPMSGERLASAHSIVFQSRAGTPELNCCSVNGPRALGLLCEWAVMRRADGLAINYYGPCRMETPEAVLRQTTDYPLDGQVAIEVTPTSDEPFTIALRIPHWSERTSVSLNDQRVQAVRPGTYLELTRSWSAGDTVRIEFDFRPQYWWWRPVETKSLDLAWTIFGPVAHAKSDRRPTRAPGSGRGEPAWSTLTAIPAQLTVHGRVYQAVRARSRGGILDESRLFPKAAKGAARSLFAFAEMEGRHGEEVTIYLGAAGAVSLSVNGETVFDNHQTGGNGHDPDERSEIVEIRLRRGRNLIALCLSAGAEEALRLTIGRARTDAELTETERDRGQAGLASVYRGPLLLAHDRSHQDADLERLPVLDGSAMRLRRVGGRRAAGPWLLCETTAVDGTKVRLCDFASAGMTGTSYETWLPVCSGQASRVAFTRDNPRRSGRRTSARPAGGRP